METNEAIAIHGHYMMQRLYDLLDRCDPFERWLMQQPPGVYAPRSSTLIPLQPFLDTHGAKIVAMCEASCLVRVGVCLVEVMAKPWLLHVLCRYAEQFHVTDQGIDRDVSRDDMLTVLADATARHWVANMQQFIPAAVFRCDVCGKCIPRTATRPMNENMLVCASCEVAADKIVNLAKRYQNGEFVPGGVS